MKSFQSTRSSQTSTLTSADIVLVLFNFNPRGLRRPRLHGIHQVLQGVLFQSTRSSQTSTSSAPPFPITRAISIHEVFADLDDSILSHFHQLFISIHEVFADLDLFHDILYPFTFRFQSTRSSQTSTPGELRIDGSPLFQSTRSSQTSTFFISRNSYSKSDFNPRGLRRPRLGHMFPIR